MQQEMMTPGDYLRIVKRRKWGLLLPMIGIVLIAVVVAFALPAVYRSQATILIEAQEVPADFVTSTVTSYVEQRIQTIQQQIMSFTPLLKIIQDYDLYPELKDKMTTEEIVEKMRKDTELAPVSTEVVDRRTGRPTTATIAFTLSYEGKDPYKVQRVANVLTSLYLEKNLEERVQQVEETSEFLEAEIDRIKKDLSNTEAEIATFKKAHMKQLPEMLQVNMQSYNNIERNIETARQQLRSLKERESYLDTQLISVEPYIEDEEEMVSRRRLEELRVQLVALTKRFTAEYPDVRKTKAEIAELESRLSELKKNKQGEPDNPAYISLKAQLASVRADIASIDQQIGILETDADEYQRSIAATPGVEEAYNRLLISRQSTQAKYNDMVNKLMEAQVAHGLETEQKGERFTLIEAPRLPEEPYKPNRLAIILIGIVLGVGVGVATAALVEFSDDRVYSPDELSRSTKFPVLVGVPLILTNADRSRIRKKRLLGAGLALVLIVCCIVVVHFAVMDLELAWLKLLRHFNMG
ncbi:MAG: chain-length determining protein [Proteobacteria bacterium]|nr:MAG: chain-length determining protein [Pseudomonadota bacterium]PIE67460.1 MAG: chain-length determining protein [Deltaproteobacteria bacterium]